MKKIIFSISLLSSMALCAQKTIVVNGGQFSNPDENVNIGVFDIPSGVSRTIDTIHTSSVQDILIDGTVAYVAAADSIVKYNLTTESRMAANSFRGLSAARLALSANNELIVTNLFGKSSYNLYVYDQTTLGIIDSIDIQRPITALATNPLGLLVVQNGTKASGFGDTLGYILAVDVANRTVVDTIRVDDYTGDIGQIVPKPDISSGFYTINSGDNSFVDFSNPSIVPPFFSTNLVSVNQDLMVGNPSKFRVNGDTVFLSMNNGIGAYNLNDLTLIDSLIVDTVVTAFAYDTLNFDFYVTATDFSTFMTGLVYNNDGDLIGDFPVGFSPEAIGIFYDQTTGTNNLELTANSESLKLYPNPSAGQVTIQLENAPQVETITIFDIKGKAVAIHNLFNGQSTINVESLPSGVYILSALSGNTIHTQRLIKE